MNLVDFLFQESRDRDTTFLVSNDGEYGYGALLSRVRTLSAGIAQRFGRGNEFLLISENGPFFIDTYLAIILSGNVPLLVETRISDADLRDVLQRSDPEAIFCQGKLASKMPEGREIITEPILDSFGNDGYGNHEDTSSDELAVVVFTSGSTGKKKGVMLTHRNIIANTSSIVQYLGLTSNDRMLVVLPFYYCYGASLLHTHLRVGGSLALFKKNFLGAVPEEINRFKCTGLAGVPSTFQILMGRSPFLKSEMPTLRYMTQAGGKLENRYIGDLFRAFPDKRFIVMYGATEATARLSYLPPEMLPDKIGSIGRGIPGVSLKVLDENGHQVEPGQVGEIVAQGDNIMKGYYKDPEGTSAVLREEGFFTGDLATIDEEGYIFIVGRSNDIIKSAGYRISPNEIENLICTLPEVSSCAVVGMPDDIMGEAVTAVIASKHGVDQGLLRGKIIELVRGTLPSYKVPKEVIFIDSIPLNTSNKMDKLAIKAMVASSRRRD